jgi:hypothetical protein
MADFGASEMMVVAMVASSASAGMAAYSSYQAGQAQKKASEYNAALAERNAANTRAASEIAAENERKANARKMASLRAGYAESGVDISEGTPLLVAMNSAAEAEKDALRIKWGGDSQANAFLGAATLSRMQGSQAETAGNLGAGASLLKGVSSASNTYIQYDKRQSLVN